MNFPEKSINETKAKKDNISAICKITYTCKAFEILLFFILPYIKIRQYHFSEKSKIFLNTLFQFCFIQTFQ
jgi:hypothetical protein